MRPGTMRTCRCAAAGRPEILFFLGACLLMQASHGAYYAFYSIYLEANGYSDSAVGALWALGVAIEVLVFMGMHRLLERFGAGACCWRAWRWRCCAGS
jgi:hypothetical protein